MSSNPFADDPTVHAEYLDGKWVQRGTTYTTRDVAALQTDMARKVDRIRGQKSLTDQAKRVAIAREYKQARDAITAMKQQETDHITSQRSKLDRKLFGHEGNADPQTVTVRREAAAIAAKLEKPTDAAHALRRAERDGDTHLAQAIASHAADHGWHDVLQTYTASRPEAAQALDQIQQLPDTNDGAWQLQQAVTYSVVQPSELGGIPDYSVDALAATEIDAA